MPRTRSRRKIGAANRRTARQCFAEATRAAARPDSKPARGVKLKTVSALTLVFSLLCLGALVAGRPPVLHSPHRRQFVRIQRPARPKLVHATAGLTVLRNH